MTSAKSKSFPRHLDSLRLITLFVNNFIRDENLNNNLSATINLAIEEIFTNQIKYNPSNLDVGISLIRGDDRLTIEITDYESKPFDPRQHQDYDDAKLNENLRTGGYGLRLVKSYIDNIEFNHHEGITRISLIKFLE